MGLLPGGEPRRVQRAHREGEGGAGERVSAAVREEGDGAAFGFRPR